MERESYEFFRPDARMVIPLAELAEELDVSVDAVRKWARVGTRGVKMRVCRIPRGLATTYEEYDSFIKAISTSTNQAREG